MTTPPDAQPGVTTMTCQTAERARPTDPLGLRPRQAGRRTEFPNLRRISG